MADSVNTSATSQVSTAVPLDPFPDGWYVIGESDDIKVGKLIEKIWMGEQIVLGGAPTGRFASPTPSVHIWGPTLARRRAARFATTTWFVRSTVSSTT